MDVCFEQYFEIVVIVVVAVYLYIVLHIADRADKQTSRNTDD